MGAHQGAGIGAGRLRALIGPSGCAKRGKESEPDADDRQHGVCPGCDHPSVPFSSVWTVLHLADLCLPSAVPGRAPEAASVPWLASHLPMVTSEEL